jgi:hypothetical protein
MTKELGSIPSRDKRFFCLVHVPDQLCGPPSEGSSSIRSRPLYDLKPKKS